MGRSRGVWRLDVPIPELIETDEEAQNLLRTLLRKTEVDPGEPIGFDTETHAMKIPLKGNSKDPLDWMRDNITFWSLAARLDDGYHRWCIERKHLHMFIPLLEGRDTHLATWNGKYDAHVSWNSGVNIWSCGNMMDLMIAGFLLDENLQGDMDLKSSAARWCGLNMTKFKDLFGDKDDKGNKLKEFETSLYDLPITKVSDYASYDAFATLRLYEYLKPELEAIPIFDIEEDSNMWEYFLDVEVPCTEILWRMERRGLCVDQAQLQEMIPPMEEEILVHERAIWKAAGCPVNFNSPPQLAWLFFGPEGVEGPNYSGGRTGQIKGMGLEPVKMTKADSPSTDEEVLEILEARGVGVAKHLNRLRKVGKLKTTYAEALLKMSQWHKDGRIHPSFKQMGARTGRFSTRHPNSQNFPRPDNDEFGIRKAFIAPEGRKLVVADYEQLEMRIMAHMSQDRNMLQAIRDGKDLHCVTVARMYPGVDYDEVKSAKDGTHPDMEGRGKQLLLWRQEAKAIGFGIIYGAGPLNISIRLGITKDEAKEKITAYFRAFPGVRSYMDRTIDECHRDKYVTTLIGRRRRLKDISHQAWVKRGHAEREAVNSTIQGTAADICKAAMFQIEFCKKLNMMGVQLLNQVHDELVMSAPEDVIEQASALIKDYMEHPFAKDEDPLDVPTPISMAVVDNWAAAK